MDAAQHRGFLQYEFRDPYTVRDVAAAADGEQVTLRAQDRLARGYPLLQATKSWRERVQRQLQRKEESAIPSRLIRFAGGCW